MLFHIIHKPDELFFCNQLQQWSHQMLQALFPKASGTQSDDELNENSGVIIFLCSEFSFSFIGGEHI